MPRKNKILIRTGSTAPTAGDFDTSEPAWDSTAGKLYCKSAAGVMVHVGPNTASPTFTGVVTVPDGSVSAPAIVSATGTADTGIYWGAADSMSFAVAGKALLTLTADSIAASHSLATTATTLSAATRNRPMWEVMQRAANGYGAYFHGYRSGNESGVFIAGHSAQIGSVSVGCVMHSTTTYNATQTSGQAIEMNGGAFKFLYGSSWTVGTAYTPTELLRITSAGNVGIGTTGPTSPLHVVGTVDCDGLIIGTTTASATGISVLGAADAAAARTTISAAAATHTHDAADIATGVISTARLGTGSPSASNYLRGDGAWSTISGGGIVEGATPSAFPATGAASTLYLATDTSRLYRYVSGTGYVEVGPVGGGDTALWSLFLPPAPTSVSGTAGNAQVALTWTAPTVAVQLPITDYVVQYSSNSGSTWSAFADGTSTSASATVTGLTNSTAYTFRVAAVNAVGQGAWSTASASVTPAAATDTYFSSVSLLLHCDGSNGSTTITDSSGTPKTVAVNGNAAISTAQSKFGGASVYCDGSGDWLNCGTHALTGDFAIEAWIYPTSIQSGYVTLWAHRSTTGGYGGACLVSNNGALEYFVANSSGTTWDISGFSSGLSLTANQWQHVVLTRSGTTLRAYKNGTGGTSTTSSGTIGTSGQMSFMAGASGGGQDVVGYIDDIRVTLGSARGYTGASITVPTAAFPNS